VSILCRLGIHRWAYQTHYDLRLGVRREIISARCSRRCPRYREWMIVHVEKFK
jgi:hypothetical protein